MQIDDIRRQPESLGWPKKLVNWYHSPHHKLGTSEANPLQTEIFWSHSPPKKLVRTVQTLWVFSTPLLMTPSHIFPMFPYFPEDRRFSTKPLTSILFNMNQNQRTRLFAIGAQIVLHRVELREGAIGRSSQSRTSQSADPKHIVKMTSLRDVLHKKITSKLTIKSKLL